MIVFTSIEENDMEYVILKNLNTQSVPEIAQIMHKAKRYRLS